MTTRARNSVLDRCFSLLGRFALGALLVAAAVLNQSAIHWRPNIADDHLFEYHGWCVSHGEVPYLDVWDNKPPGIWWLNAAAFALLGPGVLPPILVSGLALFTALVAFVRLARRAYRSSLAWPAALVGVALLTDQRFECGGNRTESYVLVCELLAVLCYVGWLRRGGAHRLMLAGLIAGAAPLFKQSGVAAILAIGLHLLYVGIAERGVVHRRRVVHALVLVAGCFAVLPLLAAAVLLCQGAFTEAWFAVATFNRAYFAVSDASWTRLDRAWRTFTPAVQMLTPLAVLASIGLLLGCAGRCAAQRRDPGAWSVRRAALPRPRRGIGLFLVWWLISVYLAAVGPGRREYHLMSSLAPLGLILIYGVHVAAGRLGLMQALTASPTRTAGVVAWAYVLVVFMPGSLAEARKCWAVKPAWLALDRTVPAPYEAQAEVVAALTHRDDRIFVAGWSPGTYRFAYRLPATRFGTFEKLGQVGEHARFVVDGAERDLRSRPPAVYVISVTEHDALLQDRTTTWGAWLAADYVHHSDVQGMRILVRRSPRVSFP